MTSEAQLIEKVWQEGYNDAVIDAGIGRGPAARAALKWAGKRAEDERLRTVARHLRAWADEAVTE